MIKKSILITCYNRPDALKKCINYLYLSNNIDNYNVVFVRQKGNLKVKTLVNKAKFKNKFSIETSYPKKFSPLKKMANNGFTGWNFCFNKLLSDYSIYLEDDIMVNYDFLNFHEFIHKKYINDPNFFGVNGFSGEKFQKSKISKYSKYVYGLGKGFSINKRVWKIFKNKIWNKKFLVKKVPSLDSANEEYVKSNNAYVVMPACSRLFELPTNGLHIKKTDTIYLNRLKKSFVKEKYKKKFYKYSFFIRYNWRGDCKKYKGTVINYLSIKLRLFFNNYRVKLNKYL